MTQQPKLQCIIVVLCLFYSCTEKSDKEKQINTHLPFTTISFNSLASFQETQASNWQTVENVYASRHEEHHLDAEKGSGILVNLPDDQNKSNLYTSFEHGDIEFELDFMMPKGSNSGIYLQGRYEIQLLDSWGKEKLSPGDCGGIYERWNDQTESGYEGIAPTLNAAKAPGLWQNLKVRFQAPRFDQSGKKIANARFLEVILNEATIHKNVEVTGPTRGSFFENESQMGPIVIQGDHGPIAFRDFRYKLYDQEKIQLADMRYKFYQGEFDSFDTLASLTPSKEAATDSLTFKAAGDFDRYAIEFEGILTAPREGDYLFDVRGYGPIRLMINNQLVAENMLAQDMSDAGYGEVNLSEGNHSFTLTFLKNDSPWRKGMSVAYEGPQIPKASLQAKSSVPTPPPPKPLIVIADENVEVQRGFLMHNGVKRTHTITVGTPQHINYALEMSNGALLDGWRGSFVDATDMWHERGEAQLIQPLGSALEFSGKPMLASLESSTAEWPDTLVTDNGPFSYNGYELNSNGLPIYQYHWNNTLIHDLILPDTTIYGLVRELDFQSDSPQNDLYCLLAEGSSIEKLEDGSYAVDDKNYYLILLEAGSSEPIIRNQGNLQQLILAVQSSSQQKVKYSLIW
ncbi:family 16 glycoside hydrolase [Catalinimonas niigatensis]|uniref:family 16 glycoside hydrolase n=1 Tax=Catalinimonas niigatensis TaxID=1397264 RepID=UPI0026667B82|nr:family 16 glycoside hydrolase [Catalinimonas niigatensis]WPP51003.1 family 16 glycoside hydrolase [Catalinimonas niigatensis]